MTNEQTALLSGSSEKENNGATARRRLQRASRFGPDVKSTGVRISRNSVSQFGIIPESMEGVPRQRKSAVAATTGSVNGTEKKKRAVAKSFMQGPDGSVSDMTPLEMGRHELYNSLPFVAVPGLQRKEHNMSIAFSSFAALLDNAETEEHMVSTTGKGMKPEEKAKRASRMSMMLLDELEGSEGVSVTMPLVFAVVVAASMAFNVGYNISVMNPSELYAFPGHSTSMWSMAVAGGPFGAVLGGKWADSKGRKGALLLTTWLFIFGGLIQTFAPNLVIVIIARLVIGVASGATSVLVPVYLGELAPPNLRGVLGTMTQFALVIGILFADVVGFPFGNDTEWRYMFILISAVGVCPLLLKSFLLESPRWLLGRNPNSAEARFVVKKLRGFRYDEEVEVEIDHITSASKSQSLDSDSDVPSKEGPKNATKELFADKDVRLLLVSSLLLQISSQLGGINAVFYYSSLFFDGIIENPLVATTLMGAINVAATYVALILMDRCGRRTLVMWSSGGMFVSCIFIVLALLGYFEKMVALFAVASYVTFFELGLGPIPSLIVGEMFDAKYVTTAMSVCSQLNWTCNFFVGLLFPYINKSLGPYSFGPFAFVLLLTFVYAWIWLPETAGTTPAELQAALIKKNENVTYHNMDIEGLASTSPGAVNEWAEALKSLEQDEEMA
ncbi:hypothetical protein ACHAXR_005359 [Thalassiosira sp. AJA248-18]